MNPPSPRLVLAAVAPLALSAALALGPVTGPASAAAGATYPPVDCGTLDVTDEAAVDQRASTVDDVFVASLLGAKTGDTPGRATWNTQVAQPLVGDVAEGPLKVVIADADEVAGTPGSSYLLFTRDSAAGPVADACHGVVLLPDGLTTELAATLEGYLAATDQATPAPDPTVHLEDPDEVPGNPPTLGRIVASGAAIALIGLLGLVAVVFAGRRRQR